MHSERLEENAGAPGSVPIEFLEPGEFQPRKIFDEQEIKALAASISEYETDASFICTSGD